MKIERIHLKNVTQHDNLTFEPGQGLNGILGPNGTGKSNLIAAARLLLMGNLVGEKTLEELIQHGEEKAEMEMDLKHKGNTFHIERSITSSSSSVRLELDGEEFTRSSRGYEKLHGLLGTTPEMVGNVVIPRQDEMDKLVSGNPSERIDMFHRLFGLEKAKKARSVLLDELNDIPDESAVESWKERLEEHLSDKEDLEERVAEFEKTLAELPDVSKGEKSRLQQQLDDLRSDRQRRESLEEEKSRLEEELNTKESQLQQARSELEEASTQLEEVEQDEDRLSDLLEKFEDQEGLRQEYLRLRDELENPRLPSFPEPSVSELQDQVEEAREKARSLQRDAVNIEQLRQAAGKALGGKDPMFDMTISEGVCNQCGRDLDNLEDVPEEKYSLDRYKHARENYKSARREAEKLESKLSEATKQATRARDAREEVKEKKERFNELQETDFIPREKAREAREKLNNIQSLEKKVDLKTDRVQTLKEEIKNLKERLEEIGNELPQLSNPEKTEGELQDRISKIEDVLSKRERIQGQLQESKDALEKRKENVEQLKEKTERGDVILRYRKLLSDTREVLHRDNLPLKVSRSVLSAVNNKMKEIAGLFDLDFTPKIREEDLMPVFTNATYTSPTPYYMLSGGELVAFSITFTIALWELFLPDCELLVLDEPTKYLDENRVSGLIDLLDKVRGWCWEEENQMILVSHDRRLQNTMDKVLRL